MDTRVSWSSRISTSPSKGCGPHHGKGDARLLETMIGELAMCYYPRSLHYALSLCRVELHHAAHVLKPWQE
jgi:hypothetical protein